MCGRFTLTIDPEQLRETMPWLEVPSGFKPRFNIAPSQPVAVVPNDGKNKLDFYVWGLIPSWAKDPQIGNRLINARSETLSEKPSFRNAFRRRRCLILADGFYEWKSAELNGRTVKTPMYIRLLSGQPFALAGLWEVWFSADGSRILSTTIITTEPNSLMAEIHNRMPVILPPEHYAQWLDPGEPELSQLQPLLTAFPASEMTAFPVSKRVNDPANDTPECIRPFEDTLLT
jgi:putative SOS response-associated peptidase YedK